MGRVDVRTETLEDLSTAHLPMPRPEGGHGKGLRFISPKRKSCQSSHAPFGTCVRAFPLRILHFDGGGGIQPAPIRRVLLKDLEVLRQTGHTVS